MSALLTKGLTAFALGAVLMLLLSFTVYRRSYYYEKAMAQAGGRRPSAGSRLMTMAILLAMILFFMLLDLWVLSGEVRSFPFLFAFNLALVGMLSLYDALFIDLFLLTVWRPGLLRLPEGQPSRPSMLRHIRLQFTAGWIFKVPIALLGAAAALGLRTGIG